MEESLFSDMKDQYYLTTSYQEINENTPKVIFIVPYRDREQQLLFFQRHIKYILEDYDENDYKIMICHQNDSRSFNCGAMKNIGFLIVKQKYPQSYHNITLVFNDIDTLPFNKNFLQLVGNYGYKTY